MGGHIKCPRIDHVAELPGDWSARNSRVSFPYHCRSSGIFCPENLVDISVPVNRGLL